MFDEKNWKDCKKNKTKICIRKEENMKSMELYVHMKLEVEKT